MDIPGQAHRVSMPTGANLDPEVAANAIRGLGTEVAGEINAFTSKVFRTRGGRLGSGMGLLLEGLWGYYMSTALGPDGIEIGWIADDQYNDFACVDAASNWDPVTRDGELFRIEAKTMNLGADESKAHFAELQSGIGVNDLLLVMTWTWAQDGSASRVWPEIRDVFLDRALPLAELRDALHIARGGSFVKAESCPDLCVPELCSHVGEPLNAKGKRERLSGPTSTRPSVNVSYAANFGGLFRMLGTSGSSSREVLTSLRNSSPTADAYVRFVEGAKLARGALGSSPISDGAL